MSSILASLDMSLDDIISKKKSNPDARPKKAERAGAQSGGAGPVRNNRRNRRRNEPYARGRGNDDDMMDVEDDGPAPGKQAPGAKRRAVTGKKSQGQPGPKGGKKGSILSRLGNKASSDSGNLGTKILVKNLTYDILEDDVRELFAIVGKVTKAEIVYDRSGRSKGIARVWFAKRGDAEKAIKQYDGRTLDNQPMSISMDAEKNVRNGLFGTELASREEGGIKFKVNLGGKNDHKGRSRRGRGGGRGNGGSSGGGASSAADLDNEMDTYMKDS